MKKLCCRLMEEYSWVYTACCMGTSLSEFSTGDSQQHIGVMKATPAMNSFIDHLASFIKEWVRGRPRPASLINVSSGKRHRLGGERYLGFVFTRLYRLSVSPCRKWTVMCVTGRGTNAINTSGLLFPERPVPLHGFLALAEVEGFLDKDGAEGWGIYVSTKC